MFDVAYLIPVYDGRILHHTEFFGPTEWELFCSAERRLAGEGYRIHPMLADGICYGAIAAKEGSE